MKTIKIFDVTVVGMFIFGLAFALSHRITNQEIPIANNVIELWPQQNYLADSVG